MTARGKPTVYLATCPEYAGKPVALAVDYDCALIGRGYADAGCNVQPLRVSVPISLYRQTWHPAPGQAVTRDTPVIGGLNLVPHVVAALGGRFIDVPDYPAGTRGRGRFGPEPRRMSISEALAEVRECGPRFVKSVAPKRLTGHVVTRAAASGDMLWEAMHDYPVWVCAPVRDIVAEWRAIVLDGKVVHVGQYRGTPCPWPAMGLRQVMQAIRDGGSRMARAYSVDIGVTRGGDTLLIECNGGLVLGMYGCPPAVAARVHRAAWEECFVGAPPATGPSLPPDEAVVPRGRVGC